MVPPRYAPLPNPRSTEEAEREMDDAFEEDDSENTPLNVSYAAPTPTHARARSTPQGTYNFEHEYEYDFPPPGSPPRPSSVALPNDIGNSNGVLPTDEPHIPRTDASSRRNFFRRTFGALLPTHYQPLPTQVNVPGRGGGLMNDGVFANVMAKPARQVQITGENGEIYMVPEDTQAEAPPSYAAASADAAPAYWETTVHAPPTLNLAGDMIIDDLPTGPFVTFIMTALVAWFFQFPGFLLAYLLHGTHAGRFGAQAGLALTLIQYGFGATMGRGINDGPYGEGEGELGTAPMPSEPVPTMPTDGTPVDTLPPAEDMLPPMYTAGHEWISFLLMTVGWFLLLTSIIGYVRVKRFELSIRAATRQGGGQYTPEEATRENALRRNLEEVFGISISAEERAQQEQQQQQAPAPAAISPERHAEIDAAEARLERDLRAAGLL